MSLKFCSILPHLQQNVLQKLTFKEYSKFSQCSNQSQLISNNLNKRIPFIKKDITAKNGDLYFMCFRTFEQISLFPILDNFPVRILAENLSLNEVSIFTCEKIIKLLENGRISIKSIGVDRIGGIDPELFNELLKIPALSIFYNRLIPFVQTPIPRDILLALKAERLNLHPANFNAKELNSFFKQWSQSSREIVFLRFLYEPDTTGFEELKKDDEIFSGIPYGFVWSPESHSNSIFSYIKKENFTSDFKDLEGLRCFSLKRENGAGEHLFVRIYRNMLVVNLVDDVMEAFEGIFCD